MFERPWKAIIPGVVLVLTHCGCGGPTTIDLVQPTPTISISPKPGVVPVNGSVTFTARMTGGGSTPKWTLSRPDYGSTTANLGTLSSSSGDTITYTAPPVSPVYVSQFPASQGVVTLQADTSATFVTIFDTTSFTITAPSVTTSITPVTATVPLGAQQAFSGAAVGSVNNAVIFQVNGVTNGSVTFGTIDNNGFYTAPRSIPMIGNTVTVTVISQADPTKSSSSAVTLQ